jgi:NAD(P)-dependent dehydrogenase (short-subunit alcohol dehydrogenase family)
MPPANTPVWFITGCSTGLGRALATLIVKRGWRAIVTARDISSIIDIVSGAEDRALALPLDLTRQIQIDAAGKRHTAAKQTNGVQPGDPVPAGEAIIAMARNTEAPRFLVLGAWGFNTVVEYLHRITQDIDANQALRLSADFDKT